ncbi:MAG: hypothetical protein WC819_03300 [Parcubacteria group bacterium]|jgi:hypothetical protein
MASISDFLVAFPGRFVIGLASAIIFFLFYFSIDIFLFLTKRNFGRVNIELVYFTRNDNPGKSGSDALHFRTIEGPVFLKKAYDNRFLFWRVVFRSARAKPVVDFEEYAYAALAPFRDRIAAKCSIGEIKRALGFPFKEKKCWVVMVNDRSEDKRRRILKVLVIQDDDLKVSLDNLPKTGKNLFLFKEVVRMFKDNSRTFLPVRITAA